MATVLERGERSIEYRITGLAMEWGVSDNDFSRLAPFYGLPEDVSGLRILDVCAGESDLTAMLLEKGADAYALDLLYGNFKTLHGKRLSKVAAGISRNKHWDEVSEAIYQREVEELEASEIFLRFKGSYERDRQSYVAGSAHSLPFSDNAFDLVLSSFGILGVLNSDLEILKLGMSEAIRVVRPGGKVQVGPMVIGSYDSVQQLNTVHIVTELRQRTDIVVNNDRKARFVNIQAQRLSIRKLPVTAAA